MPPFAFSNAGRTLLGGGGSAPGAPLTRDEEEDMTRKLRQLSADPLNIERGDREFQAFKTEQYQRAFPGKQPLDATGRGIDMPPVVRDVEPFKPKVRRDDLVLRAPVGEKAKNKFPDLLGVKRALSNTGLFPFDVTREPSNKAGPIFTDSLKAFQRNRGLKVDGLMNPEGPTVKSLRKVLFPEGHTGNVGKPVDLRGALQRKLYSTLQDPENRALFDVFRTSSHERTELPAPPSVIGLRGDLGPNRGNHPRDVLALRGVLASVGYLPARSIIGANDLNDDDIGAVERFQKAAGLKIDGLVRQGGATERALNTAFAPLLAPAEQKLPASAVARPAGISEGEKDLCDERYSRELTSCSRLSGKWHGPCAERATIRWALCYKFGYPPGPNREPSVWGPGDMEEGFNPRR